MKRDDETQTEFAIRLIREDAAKVERERCATLVSHALCDSAEDQELFAAHRKYFAELIRSGANF